MRIFFRSSFRISLVLFSIVLSLLVVEKILEVRGYTYKPLLVAQNIRPETAGYFYDPELIYTAKYQINNPLPSEVGLKNQIQLRPDSISNASASGNTFTVVTLGDSFTYGHNLADSDTYPSQLETVLTENGYNVNVFNAGVSGYGIDQEYVFLKRILASYKPNLVILNLNENDISDSNENCLFKKELSGDFVRVTGITSNTYILYQVLVHVPESIKKSRVLNLFLAGLSLEGPHNFVCSQKYTSELERLMLDKIEGLITKIAHELPSGTNLMLTFVPMQDYFRYTTKDTYRLSNRKKIIKQLSNFSILDVNKKIAGNLYPEIYVLREDTDVRIAGANTVSGFVDMPYSSVDIPYPDTQLFLNALTEPESPYGSRHPSRLGNFLFARSVAKEIIEKYLGEQHLESYNNSIKVP